MGENSWVNNDLSIEKKSLETLFAPICSARPLLLLGLLFRGSIRNNGEESKAFLQNKLM